MDIKTELQASISKAIAAIYQAENMEVKLEKTNVDFQGDYTFVVFPLLRISKKNPETTANEIGEWLKQNEPLVNSVNTVKGFLNIELNDIIWNRFLTDNWQNQRFCTSTVGGGEKVMVEYSSPNTNKPLHLGHMRNILLGYSVAEILKANGYQVTKANLINDRGIHICKSMLAWEKFGHGETPSSSGIKGDHLVGKYYVEFDKQNKKSIAELIASGVSQEAAEKQSPLLLETQEMLRKWEAGDQETIDLWKTMNNWVYEGFEKTYSRLGVDFDKFYYESDTYKLGKDLINEGLEKGVFFKKEDGSVWIDLTEDGLDQKLVLRSDGTSVYITQDIGTADEKFKNFGMSKSIYVVGNEQDYHFKVLFLILSKLGKSYAPGLHHLSYGMVDLPEGKMKSREGTVVDADDLIETMKETAKEKTLELGKTQGLSEAELDNLYETLGLTALKFFILKVDPKKRMLFNPKESIDFQGDTGPFVLYTYTRIQSILRQAPENWREAKTESPMHALEKALVKQLFEFPEAMSEAARTYSPSVLCHYLLELAKAFNRVYNELPILKEADEPLKFRRLQMSSFTSTVIQNALRVLGIKTVERM